MYETKLNLVNCMNEQQRQNTKDLLFKTIKGEFIPKRYKPKIQRL